MSETSTRTTEMAAAPVETPYLETERLRLAPLEASDADAIQAAFQHWEVVRYLNANVPWPYPPGEAAAYLDNIVLPRMRRGVLWGWSLRLHSAPERLVGSLVLEESADNNRGFWLLPALWGQGLMSEACERANAFWFETLGKPVLRVPKAIDNVRSRRLSEREGMRCVAAYDNDYVSGRLPTERWELTAAEWRTGRPDHSR